MPGKKEYHDLSFPSHLLTMLGSKTSLKDRWRQVINEANRIDLKHLLTLQAPISEDQTDEMQQEKVQLVIPRQYHADGFSERQQAWLMGVSDFLDEVRKRQASMPADTGGDQLEFTLQ
ncbi:type II restriction endonuclease [Arthrobacter sp. SD76]|uniref:type II restriction endonuclease n=1 Tax=Arthrobacter sp. SD76 TaxID=3415007 RepID=UPI003C7614D9